MFNNRMLAVAAVLALAVPALGAAAPVVISTKTDEQLVEGHTVFAVIETSSTTEQAGATRFAAAVAVLVREYTANANNVRFPGVLWFNDQYLVNPQDQKDRAESWRYPCGGAVMAVNKGDPDPRLLLAYANVTTAGGSREVSNGPDDYGRAWAYADVDTTTTSVNDTDPVNSTGPSADVHSDGFLSPTLRPLGVSNFGVSYAESYQITDPNDHFWVIDKYNAYHRTSAASLNAPVYTYPLWVVNIMGTPAFIPDDGMLNCYPFYDGAFKPVFDIPKNMSCQNPGLPRMGLQARDEPCKGYANPDRNNRYCYNGEPVPTSGSCANSPVRLYNALLYFRFEDLTDAGTTKTHGASSLDTNGCQAGTEWSCPTVNGVEQDDMEGNSHPFHPRDPTTHSDDTSTCQATGSGQTSGVGRNHGGSGGATYTGGGKWTGAPCDSTHATRDIDIYFSPYGRPARPSQATNGVNEPFLSGGGQGSDAKFFDSPGEYWQNQH